MDELTEAQQALVNYYIDIAVEDSPKFDPSKYTDNPDLEFRDISNERWRTYIFPTAEGLPNVEIKIDDPKAVATKPPPPGVSGGGPHRIVCKDGLGCYVPAGWIGIEWEWIEGVKWDW